MDYAQEVCYNYYVMRKLAGAKLKKFNKKHKTAIKIVLVLDNLEYARNVAAIFNLAYALKVEKIYLSGITPTPPFGKELSKVSRQREEQIHWEKSKDVSKTMALLRREGHSLLTLSKTDNSLAFSSLKDSLVTDKVAIIVGNEKQGLANSLLEKSDRSVYVPVYRPLAHLNVVNELAVVAYNLI